MLPPHRPRTVEPRTTRMSSCVRLALLLSSLSLFNVACAGHVPQPYVPPPEAPPAPVLKSVPFALIHTNGVTIRSADGLFQLRAGAQAPTPFASPDCPETPDTTNYQLAIQAGARAVWVDMPGPTSAACRHPALLRRARQSATGPAARMHLVRIPDQYVDATAGGRMSVVYEPLMADGRNIPTWMLYLSEHPVPGLVWASSGDAGPVSVGTSTPPAEQFPAAPGTVGLRLASRTGQIRGLRRSTRRSGGGSGHRFGRRHRLDRARCPRRNCRCSRSRPL